MTQRIQVLLAACVIAVLAPLIAQGRPPKGHAARPESRQAASKQEESHGERVFKQNCARCHEAPQSFPPQIAGTIVRHMRVRASLSAQDEKAVMEFMNP
jgi:mono/diheme cytochrome c family protein